ncbi:N-acetylmuramoyl-L-alanine amidase [Spirillospora sp. NPDC048819]|uniref:N-acetylmuramoyl-L-alanine amidase n=1 Tax=Spirillospora sp. NPDC048819 TaxID=3155268 RepID=UPI0033C253DA
MDIISRSEWGARSPRNRQTVSWSQRTEFVVHYSEGPTSQSVRSIQDFHMDGRGWADIGYNFLVDVKGRIYEGRGWLVIGAHAPDHNTSGIGVCMIGRDGDATAAAKRSIRWVYDEAVRRRGRSLKKLGHRDVYATSCPGDELYAWVRAGMPASGSEDDMPSAEEIATAVWKHKISNQFRTDGNGNPRMVAAEDFLEYSDAHHDAVMARLKAQGAAIGELSRALAALAADRGQTVDSEALIARINGEIDRVSAQPDAG